MPHLHLASSRRGTKTKLGNFRKPERMLRPTNQSYFGRKIYSNGFGERFIVELVSGAALSLVRVSEINGSLENPRYLATIRTFRNSLYLNSFVQLRWGEPTKLTLFTEHFPTRLILDCSIKLAEAKGLKTIYAEAKNTEAASRLLQFGFKFPESEYAGDWMVLELP